jgi:hypothetical protein
MKQQFIVPSNPVSVGEITQSNLGALAVASVIWLHSLGTGEVMIAYYCYRSNQRSTSHPIPSLAALPLLASWLSNLIIFCLAFSSTFETDTMNSRRYRDAKSVHPSAGEGIRRARADVRVLFSI